MRLQEASSQKPGARRGGRRCALGFTLSEVLISVFILGIGLIMLATVFPVAGNWARQSSEESVGLVIGQTALGVISTRYTAGDFASVGTNVVPIPGLDTASTTTSTVITRNVTKSIVVGNASLFSVGRRVLISGNSQTETVTVTSVSGTTIGITLTQGSYSAGASVTVMTVLPWATRFYAMGTQDPWPVMSGRVPPMFCWTALVRRQPGQPPGASSQFDVFILVCKKGEMEQTFGTDAAAAGRAAGDLKDVATNTKYFSPYLALSTVGNLPVGVRAVGSTSGTVFRKLSAANETSLPVSDSNVWYVPAADGADARSSPLVYVYQATLVF